MKQEEYTPIASIVDYLEQLCAQGVSGTLFIATRTHLNAQIALNQGRIMFVQYQGKRGMEAVQRLQTIKEGRFRLQTGLLTSLSDSLPASAALCRLLRGQPMENPTGSAMNIAPANSGSITSQQMKLLEEHLTEYVGPVATLLVKEHCQPGMSLTKIVETLASEVLSAEEAQAFRKKMLH